MNILITGIAGFVGSHLADYLCQETDHEIHGIIHRHDRRIQHLRDKIHLHRGDLRDGLWVSDLIQKVKPDRLMHLAAWSDVGGSWHQPWTAYELNVQCQLNLLEGLCRWQPQCRTLVVSSNEVYGLVRPEDLPIDEFTFFRPNTPYGVSKIAQDMMGLQYWNSHKLPVIRARSFNHIGPAQAEEFVASAFAKQIAEIELGQREPIVNVGNLAAERDFTDVRDVVRAYWLITEKGEPGLVYNVGRGRSYPIQYILDTLINLSTAKVEVTVDPARLRPSDVPVSVCDNSRLKGATGWEPKYALEDTLTELLDYWRAQIKFSTHSTE